MALMGKANWWVPKWLDRILPHLDLEGSSAPLPAAGETPSISDEDTDEEVVPTAA
jgi:RND superfamily putative drug exporter